MLTMEFLCALTLQCWSRWPGKKHSIFKPVSKAAKLKTNTPKTPENTKTLSWNFQKTTSAKTFCLQYTPHEHFVLVAPTAGIFISKNVQQKTGNKPETKLNLAHLSPLSRWDPKINPKSRTNWLRNPTCLFSCSHALQRCSQAAEIIPKVPKWRHQACQIIGFEHPKSQDSYPK